MTFAMLVIGVAVLAFVVKRAKRGAAEGADDRARFRAVAAEKRKAKREAMLDAHAEKKAARPRKS